MAKFMVVDDSVFQRKNLGKMINQMGWEVIAEASNGREAVELYADRKPDLVLMDLVMPEMEGIEALEKIIEIDKDAKVIIVSSIGYDEMVKKAIALGARQFVVKPVSLGNMAETIKSVMEGI